MYVWACVEMIVVLVTAGAREAEGKRRKSKVYVMYRKRFLRACRGERVVMRMIRRVGTLERPLGEPRAFLSLVPLLGRCCCRV